MSGFCAFPPRGLVNEWGHEWLNIIPNASSSPLKYNVAFLFFFICFSKERKPPSSPRIIHRKKIKSYGSKIVPCTVFIYRTNGVFWPRAPFGIRRATVRRLWRSGCPFLRLCGRGQRRPPCPCVNPVRATILNLTCAWVVPERVRGVTHWRGCLGW